MDFQKKNHGFSKKHLCPTVFFFVKSHFLLIIWQKSLRRSERKSILISLGRLVVANSLQVKHLKVNEKLILINETKVAKREASPGVSQAKNHTRYRSGSNFTTEYSPSTSSLKLSRNVIISHSSD